MCAHFVMVYAFDTLSYARRLKEAGVPQPQAEAHADAAREFVMGELVTRADLVELATKSDLLVVKSDLAAVKSDLQTVKSDVQTVKSDLQTVRSDVRTVKSDLQTTKSDLQTVKSDLHSDLLAVKSELQTSIGKLDAKLDKLELRTTVKLGVLMATGIVLLGAINKLT